MNDDILFERFQYVCNKYRGGVILAAFHMGLDRTYQDVVGTYVTVQNTGLMVNRSVN